MAIVTFAQMPRRFVRNGGAEYSTVITVATATIQKHSWRWPGATNQASTSATAYPTSVKVQASRIDSLPEGKARLGLLILSISRS